MSDVAVSVESLGKRYQITHQQERYGRLTETIAGAIKAVPGVVQVEAL